MARRTARPRPTQAQKLTPVTVTCPHCKRPTRADYTNFRTVSRLDGVLRLALRVRRWHTADCPPRLRPYRPRPRAGSPCRTTNSASTSWHSSADSATPSTAPRPRSTRSWSFAA